MGSSEHGIGYTGHVKDKDLGLTYMQARYYDPTVGRFMGTDPVTFRATNPELFNRYAYANNNPYYFIDPDGRQSYPGLMNAIKHKIANAFASAAQDAVPTKAEARDALKTTSGLAVTGAAASAITGIGAPAAGPLTGLAVSSGLLSAALEEEPVPALAKEIGGNIVGTKIVKTPFDIIRGFFKKEKSDVLDAIEDYTADQVSDGIGNAFEPMPEDTERLSIGTETTEEND